MIIEDANKDKDAETVLLNAKTILCRSLRLEARSLKTIMILTRESAEVKAQLKRLDGFPCRFGFYDFP
jgi:hypothetical protein